MQEPKLRQGTVKKKEERLQEIGKRKKRAAYDNRAMWRKTKKLPKRGKIRSLEVVPPCWEKKKPDCRSSKLVNGKTKLVDLIEGMKDGVAVILAWGVVKTVGRFRSCFAD